MGKVVLAALGILLVGCGDLSLDLSQNLEINMYGVAKEPTEAGGDVTPTSEVFVLAGVSLRSADGSETTVLYSGDDPQEVEVVNRPQLIYFQDISSLDQTTYSGFTLTFSALIKGESKNSSAHEVYLTTTEYLHLEEFTVETGKDILIDVQVKWRNTVSGESLVAPEFSFLLESS